MMHSVIIRPARQWSSKYRVPSEQDTVWHREGQSWVGVQPKPGYWPRVFLSLCATCSWPWMQPWGKMTLCAFWCTEPLHMLIPYIGPLHMLVTQPATLFPWVWMTFKWLYFVVVLLLLLLFDYYISHLFICVCACTHTQMLLSTLLEGWRTDAWQQVPFSWAILMAIAVGHQTTELRSGKAKQWSVKSFQAPPLRKIPESTMNLLAP